jgi:hypothetical protein
MYSSFFQFPADVAGFPRRCPHFWIANEKRKNFQKDVRISPIILTTDSQCKKVTQGNVMEYGLRCRLPIRLPNCDQEQTLKPFRRSSQVLKNKIFCS